MLTISNTDLPSWITAFATVIYTIGSLALWYISSKQISLLKKQQEIIEKDFEKQQKYLDSASTHAIVDRHRDIFFQIIRDKELVKVFSKASKKRITQTKKDFLASIIINHAQSIWLDFINKVRSEREFDSFKRDFSDVVNMKFIKDRWEKVKDFHSQEFKDFVNNFIIND
ncbi:hypothetical protein EZY14_004195 [Kordia sp. TARA_039_SRF]|nr:hypothetical protein EZY14_004195 [Kordia sp. TARA_039_SRF]